MNELNLMNKLVSNQLRTNVCLGMELVSQHMILHAISTRILILNITHGQDAQPIMIIVMVIEIHVLQINRRFTMLNQRVFIIGLHKF